MTTKNAAYYIEKLQMEAHPEGGFYKETYRSDFLVNNANGAERNICTAIYFLLADSDKSHFHRIQSNELWFHHQGETLEIVFIQNGILNTVYLGANLDDGEVFQTTIPANTWFASKLKNSNGFGLVSCTVAPGFDFSDFEMANKQSLLQEYPDLKNVIETYALPL
jgi:predicted cupin superfamily sugar epimerase